MILGQLRMGARQAKNAPLDMTTLHLNEDDSATKKQNMKTAVYTKTCNQFFSAGSQTY